MKPLTRSAGRGMSKLGCLLVLVILGTGVYYGIPVTSSYMRYFRLLDEMKMQARFAPGLDNPVIRRRLVAQADELRLPPDARKFSIWRRGRPREITITTSWQETFTFPFYTHTITFRPEAKAPL